MPKKQIFGSIIILVILSFICMFIYNEFKDEQQERKTKLIVEKGDNKLTLYYTDPDGRNYYLYGLDKIIVDYGDHDLELDKALEAKQFSMESVIELIGNKNQQSYWDGGSIKINNDDLSLLQCHTNNGNEDYYFGPSDMKKKEGFCKDEPYICSFIKTYLVLDVSDSNDEKHVYLTLKQFQGEEVVTVKVERSLIGEMIEDQSYEFQFTSVEITDEESIEDIFKNHELVSIIATDKVGLDQINESVCK